MLRVFDLRRAALAILAAAMLIAAPAVAQAQQQEVAPEHLALARQYVDLTDKSGAYEVALLQVGIETMRTLLSQNPKIADPLDAAITKTLESYKTRKGELMDQFARLYALRFTMEELQQIVDFYKSPVGQKLAIATSEMPRDLQAVMTIFEANLRTEFFAKVRAELKAAGIDS
jgi:hypothetical protein